MSKTENPKQYDLEDRIITSVGQASRLSENSAGQATSSAEQPMNPIGQPMIPVGQASRLPENRLSEKSWRRRLPHFQLSSGYYFITFSTHNRQPLLPSQKDAVFNAIHFLNQKRYELLAVVVMDDHVHMVLNPLDTLSRIMHSIKSFTAHQINKASNRRGKLWQDENLDRYIRDQEELLQKLNYIANNPIKANLAAKYGDYRWLYIKGWINDNA